MVLSNRWISYFFTLTYAVASQSKDPDTKVGALAIGDAKQPVASGYNGIPIGVNDDPIKHPERYDRAKFKYQCVSHAEMNVISFCAREGIALKGTTLFCTLQPCIECTKLIIMAGIKELHYILPTEEREWTKHLPLAKEMLQEARVNIHEYTLHDVEELLRLRNKGLR